MLLYEATFAELDAHTLYALLRLRTDVFVVEQQCPYPELDGRDEEPLTRHLWLAPADARTDPHAYLRLLTDQDGTAPGGTAPGGTAPGGTARIGRVCTAAKARGAGLAGQLMAAALRHVGERPCVLEAQ